MNLTFPERKNVIIILNGISPKKKFFYRHLLPLLSGLANVEVFETRSKNDAVSLASQAVGQSADLIVAAGGDGTLNQVVNGMLTGRETEIKFPVIGLIPLGSGNDFARTAEIKANAELLKKLIIRFEPKTIDIGKVRFTPFSVNSIEATSERYFVNVADMGMGPVVVDKVQRSGRAFGHGVAYYKSILSTFISYKPMTVNAAAKDWAWEGKLRTLAIGNGKCYGHGLHIAPDAVLDDRLFNVFICGDVSVFDFIRFTGTLKKGGYVRLPEVHYRVATSLALTSDKPCMIEGDGEIFGKLPATVTLADKKLDFLI